MVIELVASNKKVVSLNVLERLLILNLLPKEGNLTNLRLMRVVREKLSFTEEENAVAKFSQEGDQLKWEAGIEDREFEFGDTVMGILVKALKELEQREKLTEGHVSLFEKFVEGEQNASK